MAISHVTIGTKTYLRIGSGLFPCGVCVAWNGSAVQVWLENGAGVFTTEATRAELDAFIASGSTGGGASIPAGLIAMWSGLLTAIPSGWVPCDGLNGTPDLRSKFVRGAAPGINPGATGGSLTHSHAAHNYTPAGSISVANFVGTLVSTSSDSAGTPGGGVAWPAQVPTFTGAALGTHSHAVGSLVNSLDSAGTPAGSVTWPAGVPTFVGAALASHAHELPFSKATGGTGALKMLAGSVFGVGTSRAPESISAAPTANSTAAAVALSEAKSAGTPAGTVAWPAGTPLFVGGALGTHTHTVTGSTATTSAGTPAGTIAYPVQVPTFTGAALPGHTHTVTAAGTIAPQTFTGTTDALGHDAANNLPPFFECAFIMKL